MAGKTYNSENNNHNRLFLIVDDDLSSRKYMHNVLAPYGECHCMPDGPEAIEAFNKIRESGRKYDLICLDLLMPRMDGHDVLKHIRQIERENQPRGFLKIFRKKKSTPIIVISSLHDSQNISQAYLNGNAISYVEKPVERQHFLELLQNIGIIS